MVAGGKEERPLVRRWKLVPMAFGISLCCETCFEIQSEIGLNYLVFDFFPGSRTDEFNLFSLIGK